MHFYTKSFQICAILQELQLSTNGYVMLAAWNKKRKRENIFANKTPSDYYQQSFGCKQKIEWNEKLILVFTETNVQSDHTKLITLIKGTQKKSEKSKW